MGPIASKILHQLRKASQKGVIDLATIRRAREEQALGPSADELDEEIGEDVPEGHRFWMKAFADLARFAWPLLGFHRLHKLRERIEQSEETYMPGGPPMSPLTDSFHTFWCLADTTVGVKRETLATIAIDLARAHRAPGPLIEAWSAIASSYPGVYKVARRSGPQVTLEDLVTGERFEVELADDVPGNEGAVWWTRLLPPPGPEHSWTSIVTPYVFPAPGAERAWRGYFARKLEAAPEGRRGEAYRELMKRGEEPFSWFEFILDAYLGVSGCAVALTGVPDRPETLPHAESEAEDAADATPLERVRRRLMELAAASGLTEQAAEEFREVRESVGRLPAAAPDDWGDGERRLLGAYAMFGVAGEDGSTAVDRLSGSAGGQLPADERAALRAFEAGWFSVFEVLRIKIDQALEVRDVLRRRRFWILERSGTRQISLGDVLAGWIMKEGEEVFLEGSVLRVPRLWAGGLVEASRAAMAELRKERHLSWKQRQARMAPRVSALVARLQRDPPHPPMANHEGHPLLLSESTYEIREEGVTASLGEAAELEPDGKGSFAWIDADRELIVAHIEVAGETLRVRTNSRERLERARAWLEERLGGSIAHRADAFSDPSSEAHERQDAPEPSEAEIPPEVREAVSQELSGRLEQWLDQPIPALGGKTPRQAVRSERGRDDVSAMLLEQERLLRQGPLAEGIDFAALWANLGLAYPEQRPPNPPR